MSIVEGYTTDNFASLRDVFEGHLTNGEDVGASIAVMLRGEMVADIWGGYVGRSDDSSVATRHDLERLVRDKDDDLPGRDDAE
jgi:hypothetical protein